VPTGDARPRSDSACSSFSICSSGEAGRPSPSRQHIGPNSRRCPHGPIRGPCWGQVGMALIPAHVGIRPERRSRGARRLLPTIGFFSPHSGCGTSRSAIRYTGLSTARGWLVALKAPHRIDTPQDQGRADLPWTLNDHRGGRDRAGPTGGPAGFCGQGQSASTKTARRSLPELAGGRFVLHSMNGEFPRPSASCSCNRSLSVSEQTTLRPVGTRGRQRSNTRRSIGCRRCSAITLFGSRDDSSRPAPPTKATPRRHGLLLQVRLVHRWAPLLHAEAYRRAVTLKPFAIDAAPPARGAAAPQLRPGAISCGGRSAASGIPACRSPAHCHQRSRGRRGPLAGGQGQGHPPLGCPPPSSSADQRDGDQRRGTRPAGLLRRSTSIQPLGQQVACWRWGKPCSLARPTP